MCHLLLREQPVPRLVKPSEPPSPVQADIWHRAACVDDDGRPEAGEAAEEEVAEASGRLK